MEEQTETQKTKSFWASFGPGITTGAADDDPSGIATYSQTGSKYGFQMLWLALFTTPFMAVIQEMCARIGMVTGRGLAANIRLNYSRWLLYLCTLLLFIANSFNIGADLGAIAKSLQLLNPALSFTVLVIGVALVSLLLQIYIPYGRYAKYLKYLTVSLLAYVVVGFMVITDWRDVLAHTVIPAFDLSRDQIFLVCGILGTTISPYLFFWQTSQEVEEEILAGRGSVEKRKGATPSEIKNMRVDSWTGMIYSNAVMFFIIAACAATLFAAGITNINSAEQAALALRPLAGNWAFLLFALGIIGTGFLAIPILAGSASYAVAESFGWKEGLYRRLSKAIGFYAVITVAVLAGLSANFLGLDPIKVLIYAAVLNGIIAPVMMVFIVLLSSDEKHMGEFANGRTLKIFGWLATALMAIVSLATIISLF